MKNGNVYLVGAGPGDPGLLTLKGKECIAKADVIIYDYLAADELLAYAKNDAEIIYAGKKGGDHTLLQDQINRLIAEKAKQGNTVTRLKGGDPFIFGRGGEEIETLIKEGISYEIVPGVTSAIAAPAYAGIPLTHRRFASMVTFVTGHEDPGKSTSSIDWKNLADNPGSLVFLMGVKNLSRIVDQLVENGKHADTPTALVRWGTTSEQQTITGTLGTIVDKVAEAGLKPPCIIIVGDVVTLREEMKWFEDHPLFGKKIIVTRARQQASSFQQRLRELGASCLECPVIRIVPPDNEAPLAAAIDRLADYDWLVFTSVNGVDAFFNMLFAKNMDVRALHHIQTACIGPATADRLLRYRLNSDIIPKSYRAESVVEAFQKVAVLGKKILLPRAREARSVIPDELSKMGAFVDEIVAYQTIQDGRNRDLLLEELHNRQIDMVTFTSSSTVTNFKALIPKENFPSLMEGITVAAIGPITADTAEKCGFTVHITAQNFTIDGLVDAILNFYCK